MASLKFPDSGSRYVEGLNGKPAVNQTGYLYADAALTTVAEAYVDVNGVKGALLPVDDSGRRYITLNAYGKQPDYWGPAAGTKRLWLVVNGVAAPVDADYNARLDAVESGGSSSAAALAEHEADTTNIHGIADTSVLETTTGAQAKATAAQSAAITAAASDATTKANTAQAAAITAAAADATSKASAAQTAAISAAATDATAKANAAQTAATSAAAAMVDDLSGVTDPAAARSALGLGTSATRAVGTTAGTVAAGDDSRLSDTRTPTVHAASHGSGGTDPITVAQSQVTGLSAALGSKADLVGGVIPTGQIPAYAVTEVFPVASQAAMLALTAERGDMAVRSDNGHRYVLQTEPASTLSNWIDLGTASGAVATVNGQSGVVVLGAADVGAVATGRTITTTAPLSGGGDLSSDRTISVADASTGAKGVLQLAGDLAGTATAPVIANNAVTSAKIADGTIVDGDISPSAAIAQSKVFGLTTALAAKMPRTSLVVDAGGAADYTTLAAALTAIGSNSADLTITSAVTMTSDTTVPANVSIRVTRAGSINLSTFVLTMNGRFSADRQSVFSGSGTITFGPGAVDEVYPEWWGAVIGSVASPPAADSGPAWTKAFDSIRTYGGDVSGVPGATYRISTTINASNFQPQSFQYNSSKSARFRGGDRHQTYFVGGETGFGFIEMVGSNFITIEGITMVTSGGTKQYGIMFGRKTGDASAQNITLRRVYIYGAFSLAAIFAMSSELGRYDDVSVYTTTGRGIVLARDNTANYGAVAKYTALSTTVPIPGGDGVINMQSCQILSISPNATDYLLTVEYPQTFTCDNLYLYSENQTSQIFMQKLCSSATWTSLHSEHGVVEPYTLYISAANATPQNPDFGYLTFIGCQMYGIYAEDGVRISNLTFLSRWRGTQTWQLDVPTLYDSTIRADGRLNGITSVASPAYRVRTNYDSVDWGTATNISVPDTELNRVTSFRNLWDKPQPGARAQLGGGRYYTTIASGTTPVTQTIGNAYAQPIWVPKTVTISRIAVHVQGASPGSTVTLGIYDSDAFDLPNALLSDYGTVDTTTTGFKEITISRVLTRGWYYLACLTLGGTPSLYATTGTHPLVSTSSQSLSSDLSGYLLSGQASLPSTWATRLGVSFTPKVSIRI